MQILFHALLLPRDDNYASTVVMLSLFVHGLWTLLFGLDRIFGHNNGIVLFFPEVIHVSKAGHHVSKLREDSIGSHIVGKGLILLTILIRMAQLGAGLGVVIGIQGACLIGTDLPHELFVVL